MVTPRHRSAAHLHGIPIAAAAHDDVAVGVIGHLLTTRPTMRSAVLARLAHHDLDPAGLAVRQAVERWSPDATPPPSLRRRAIARLVTDHGLAPFDRRSHVGGRRVDAVVAGAPIALACDRWLDDRTTTGRCAAASTIAEWHERGWTLLVPSYRRLVEQPGEVADDVRRAIERWTDRVA